MTMELTATTSELRIVVGVIELTTLLLLVLAAILCGLLKSMQTTALPTVKSIQDNLPRKKVKWY